MGSLFLFLGYMGVPVAFSLIAAVLVVTAFTPVSYASMMAQLFNGMDVEALVAIPFFLLVGDLMTSANVTVRMIRLAQSMVGHLRGGLAQVVTTVQHVLCRHFGVVGRRRRGARADDWAGDAP